MTDVILIATIVVFFLAAAQLVRVLGRGIVDPAVAADSAGDADEDADAGAARGLGQAASVHVPEPGRPA
jgi:hypothetical protein